MPIRYLGSPIFSLAITKGRKQIVRGDSAPRVEARCAPEERSSRIRFVLLGSALPASQQGTAVARGLDAAQEPALRRASERPDLSGMSTGSGASPK
jgi:hypothetical protein